MEKLVEKQSRFFCGNKKELLQLLCIFPHHTVCNSYAELSPYYPCIFLGEIFEDIGYQNTIFFIISDRKIDENFLYISETKLKSILCDFFKCIPPFESNEPFFSLIYKYSLTGNDVRCLIPIEEESTMSSISNSINNIRKMYYLDEKQKLIWSFILKRIRYSFLKTGNLTLGNYIILLENILEKNIRRT